MTKLRARPARLAALLALAALLGACAAPAPYDYTAFRQARPASLLVLPPLNDSADVKAVAGVLATATAPLAEAGYYVLPVSMVDETFRQNGMTTPHDIQQVSTAKLREIFGADAAVYLRVKDYGTRYLVVGSDTRVTVEGRIVDLRSGALLWEGRATASSQESNNNNQGGLVGLLVKALVEQIVGTVTDASFNYAGIANQRLLGAPVRNGILFGPRSPRYQKD
ncbi:MAG: DUF799 domain-containing protein [Piscinibacter sp.]|uniref:DUF799 domain-containing protein n=1 Tax=Piscinibacter TaxID=1114981 RepID=UPI000FDE0840|nr:MULTISPECIES: DUF799 domain-containing protein [Piscinibacter]MCW5665137.1 DUF799 domain-containing protein [Piscinibacter sp.]